jgi:hypothetical protein
LIRNEEMTINNLVEVSKRHVKNTNGNKLDMNFSFWAIRGHQEVEGRGLWIQC